MPDSRFEELALLAPVGLFETDAQGRGVYANERWCELTGLTREEALGEGWTRAIHPDDRELVVREWSACAREEREFDLTFRLQSSGRVRWVQSAARPRRDASGTVTGFVGAVTDVTRAKELEERLRNAEEELRARLENAPDAVLVHRAGRIVSANRVLREIVGVRRPEDFIGRPVLEFLHPDDAHKVASRIDAVNSGRIAGAPPVESRIRRSDGTYVLLEWTNATAVIEGERVVIAAGRDVSERKRLEDRLARADRLASVGTLAAGVAHEVNNPLAFVAANVEYLIGEVSNAAQAPAAAHFDDMVEVMGEVRLGVDRIRRIVRSLKTFARPEHDVHVPQPLGSILDLATELTATQIRHRARLVKEIDKTPLVAADDGRLVQVFVKLLTNAAQAIPEGRADANTIRLATHTDEEGRAVVTVSDTGIGIPPENLKRVFDPFFTTKPVGEGTGLGLSIAHGIVEALGGSITIESTPGEGTTVQVVLPGAAPVDEPEAPAPSPPAPAPTSRAVILIVDDEPLVLRSLERMLGSAHEVSTATSGADAFARLSSGARYDVVLCDVMMPIMTGMELYARVVSEMPDQASRFVFLTGGAFTPEARGFLAKVGLPHMEKPVDMHALRALVHGRAGWVTASPA